MDASTDDAGQSPALSEELPAIAAEHGLDLPEWRMILEILGREPNLVELGIFSVMWSEHCSYKSSKAHLAKFPTKAPWVVHGPGENAGVVDIGDGQVAVFKMESHNHPSFIEPYQGAATGVGGILRDVFTMGARPVALMNALRFGDASHPKTKHLVSGVVAGIGGYGNCVGVPTVGGECTFHRAYNGNILVNAMAVGVADKDRVFLAEASGIGNPVIYVGAKTGRDGIHGATMASAEFSEEKEAARPTVQVGDPFTEKLLIEACLELMATDCLVAIQDMGAAGLTSSSFEMASKGNCGIEMNLSAVPMREDGMSAYEVMLSESQERMLCVLERGKEEQARAIFEKWELSFAEVGTITDTGRMVLRWEGEVVADVPIAPVSGASPVYERPFEPQTYRVPFLAERVRARPSPERALLTLIATPDLCSKRWIWEQYDHTVMADTVAGPGGDAAVVRVHGTDKGLALTTDCTPRYCEHDAREGGKQAVAEAWRNLLCVGAEPLAITNCLNFGNPERPRVMGQFVNAVEGMAEACAALDFPVVSGNVSLYNETDGRAVQPTPNVGGLGLIRDLNKVMGLALPGPGLALVLVGEATGWMGCSLYLREISKREEGAPPPVDLAAERRNGELVAGLIRDGLVRAAHDVSDGGLAVAVAEMCLGRGVGAYLDIPEGVDEVGWLFGEEQGRYVLAVRAEDEAAVLRLAKRAGVLARTVGGSGKRQGQGELALSSGAGAGGATVGPVLRLGSHPPLPLEVLRRAHEATLPALMAGPDANA